MDAKPHLYCKDACKARNNFLIILSGLFHRNGHAKNHGYYINIYFSNYIMMILHKVNTRAYNWYITLYSLINSNKTLESVSGKAKSGLL